ncbi:glycine zipper family protein [Candidatus Viadribacter manganicus]|uniref:Glycine-zipper-containing OmpA-like membrane domain-containing protein n=1 Tax=Candidatus Viadribacter manganicus TaxID=1759059 RepID=A0A1B1AH49_9PROT|nr:glycine zipper family protein [Candidatus Viadribacter manganicus]ANP45875.1 hypothetical protein ATE48_08045 [Candidatus Viadribacter manganicus]
MRFLQTALLSISALAMTACAGMSPSERNAATGAAVGGVAGALIGGDAGSAAIGALAGGGVGWYLGCREEGRCGAVNNRRQSYDQRSGRYYFRDQQSGRYFYENGEPYNG